jgi:hypothetical protein
VYDVGPDYLVMEYLEGETLAQQMAADRQPVPMLDALAIAIQIAGAVAARTTATSFIAI